MLHITTVKAGARGPYLRSPPFWYLSAEFTVLLLASSENLLLFVIKEKKMLVHIVQYKVHRTAQGREQEAGGERRGPTVMFLESNNLLSCSAIVR